MIADLKPYLEYKESGLPWLGQVPGHWETRRLRHACEMRVSNVDKHTKQDETPVRLCNYVEVYKNERIRESTRFMSASASEDERIRFCLRKGDVLITKDSEQWNDIGVPSLVEFEAPDLVCGYHLAILRPRPLLHGSFLHRALECHFIAAQFHVEANGVTRYGLSHGAIQGVSIPLPPPAEQAAIVRFLDWANGRLERAIRAKRKVIALLTEQKQAIIHRAVTRGLDPSVPLKPSGIPWLGDIPQHWEVRRLKFVASQIVDCLHATPRYSESGSHPAIRTADISPGIVHVSKAKRISLRDYARWTARLEPLEGDILYSREGERFGIAACVPAGVQLCISQRMMVFRIAKEYCSHFVMCILNSKSTYGQALQDVMGATAPHVNISTIRNYFLAMPTKQEQKMIVRHVESETRPIETAITRLEREIELLREYRTRLVADVVTGKLDVREAAARLPEEATPDTAEKPVDGLDETEPADEEAAV
jgi:type I restriction enzyme, S subunit